MKATTLEEWFQLEPVTTRPIIIFTTQEILNMKPSKEAIQKGRERIAKLAEADGEIIFAGEVLAGAWDTRNDVSYAIAKIEFNLRMDEKLEEFGLTFNDKGSPIYPKGAENREAFYALLTDWIFEIHKDAYGQGFADGKEQWR